MAHPFSFYVFSARRIHTTLRHDVTESVNGVVSRLHRGFYPGLCFGFRCSSGRGCPILALFEGGAFGHVLGLARRPCLSCSVNWKLQLDECQLRKIMSLCEQFLLDAAVLIFVFPVLDTIVQFGKEEITAKLIAGTLAISGVFFIGALVVGMMAANGKE